MSSSSSHSTRARFLSSSTAAFITATTSVFAFVAANNPEECLAETGAKGSSNNPRYIDKELQMKYGESPGMSIECIITISAS
jgi:hypothetical protein